jgi:hypothetical protein
MSWCSWREVALVSSTALVGSLAEAAVAQEKTTPLLFSWDLAVGWIGVGGFQPVPGRVPPLTQDPKYPSFPTAPAVSQPIGLPT